MSAFQPKCMSWSYLNRGNVHRTHIKKKMKNMIFAKNTPTPIKAMALEFNPKSFINGKLYPPKNNTDITAEDINMFIYSAKR